MASSPTVIPAAVRLPTDVPAGAIATPAPAAVRPSARNSGQSDDRLVESGNAIETSAAIGELVEALKTTSISLRFEIDESTHRVITKVVDKETGELIRQMPTAEVLRLARAIDKLQGQFISQAV
ncbi:flagellar protein FlaG [Cupriavidus necator]|uniref:flagellar protein FlaG n=1 Tax=Cupriavidus necator TaxID=106590 RepID=UPI00278283B5|nr:flagellar protein FlaG [Cupriavidus necator]MDQ0139938.1 flagellar protein FlaG [Cupriavidus necator]